MKLGIIGAGQFGTAIAQAFSSNFDEVILFGRDPKIIDEINKHHTNSNYFPGFRLCDKIGAEPIIKDGPVLDADLIFFATPSGATRSIAHSMKRTIGNSLIVSGSKGIEVDSKKTMCTVIREEIGAENVFSFSGPTFANELLNGIYSGATVGIKQNKFENVFKDLLSADNIFLDFSDDVEAVELAGVMKNVYAISAGIYDSIYNGHNSHHLFLNLCFKEMANALKKISSDKEIANKFCAFGDLNLTSSVDKSRNRTIGLIIGKELANASDVSNDVIFEGINSIKSMREIFQENDVSGPILESTYDIIMSKEKRYARIKMNELMGQLQK